MYSVPSESTTITYPEITVTNGTVTSTLPHPFTYIVKAFILVEWMVKVLLAPSSESDSGGLARVQMALDRFIGQLPPALRFDTASFQAYAAAGQGGAFALLHVSWRKAVLTIGLAPCVGLKTADD
jgi:hypothetical protein